MFSCAVQLITRQLAILSCRPCFFFVNPIIGKPIHSASESGFQKFLANALPNEIRPPERSVTLRRSIFFPTVACHRDDSHSA
jgi:hypothetical protein